MNRFLHQTLGAQAEHRLQLQSVEEAVRKVQAMFPEELVFGKDVWKSLQQLAQQAGPPAKVFRSLVQLANLQRELVSGGPGKSWVQWFRDRGIACSRESETVRNGHARRRGRGRRIWDDGTGRKLFFEWHLKVNSGTSPHLCVRIYFRWDGGRKKMVVGWLGRHP